jgi:hypothetical protein
MKKAAIFSLLFMFVVLFLLAITIDVSNAASKGETDPGEVDPHGFLGIKFGEDKTTVEKKLYSQGFRVRFYKENNTDAIISSGPRVLGEKAIVLGCYFSSYRLRSIKVVWALENAPELARSLRSKYGIADVLDTDNNLREWYIGDTMITLFLDEDDDVTLIYSSISLNEVEADKKSKGIKNSL